MYASRGQKQTIDTSAVVLPARSTAPRRSFAPPRYIFGSTQARQPSSGLRPLRLAASAGVRLGGSPAAQRYSDWKKDKGVTVFATIALEQWKQRVTSRIRRRS